MTERTQIVLFGIVSAILGASVCLIALGVIPYDEDKIHAPAWVILLAGGVFVLAGLAMLFRHHPLVVSILGNLIVMSFAVAAAWVSIAGPAEQFSGGFPLLSRALNVKIARVVFACSAVLCALILIPGIKQFLQIVSELRNARRKATTDEAGAAPVTRLDRSQ